MKKIIVFTLLVMLCTTAFAGSLGLKSISPKVGLAMPENLDTTFYLGVGANMGEITENLDLVPYLGFWSSGKDLYGGDWSYSDFILGADVHYGIESVEGLYAGGGLSLNILTFSWEYPTIYGDEDGSDSETKIGIDILAGYEIPVAGKTAFAEIKYNIIDHFNTLEITIGMNFDM